ncbi:hypothetical protein [Arthrobacter sp. SAFR-014]|uniref:hypothetical protein n=1 Tax=unclassified Arthrobacter TaxID=235627 RepID=UPI003F7BCFAB
MDQDSPGGRTLSSPMIAVIAIGVVLVTVIVILVGVRLGQSLTSAPSSAVSSPGAASSTAEVPASTPKVESKPTESTEPEPTESSTAPTVSVPRHFERVTPAPVPEQSFAEVQPLPPPPPTVGQADVVAAAPPSPTPEPTCPADEGVALTLVRAEPVPGSDVFDALKLTFVLDSRFSVPVSIEVGDLLTVSAVRVNGAEMGTGYVDLPETYEVPPGRTTFATDESHHLLAFRNFGSPIASLKLSGSARLITRTWDSENSMFCQYRGMTLGKPLQGNWGS